MSTRADCGTLPLWTEGAEARDEGITLAETARGAEWDRQTIDHAIRHFAGTGREFSSNNVRELLPAVAPAMIGARFMAAARSGLIRRTGDTLATHRAGHARRVSTWRGREEA